MNTTYSIGTRAANRLVGRAVRPGSALGALLLQALACPPTGPSWSVARNDTVLEVGYGKGSDLPQVAALHLASSYLRLNPGPSSGWGTSVVLLPSFWSGGTLHQGAPVEATWESRGDDLILSLRGTLAGLTVALEVRMSPPAGDSLRATVTGRAEGDIQLDARPGEAFKLLMLSSMHIAPDRWDTQSATISGETLAIPGAGWIVNPAVTAGRFGLRGGTSAWKVNAPTIEISLEEPRAITGWVTPSTDPNDDNVGFWAASDRVVPAWRYAIVARR